jgi:glycosyltransferase involved in cell wall biosynthesis
MRILIVAFADIVASALGKRIHELSKGLVRNGCDVSVVAPMNFHGHEHEESIEGVRVLWATSAIPSDVHSNLKRIRARVKFYRLLIRLLNSGVDAVVFSNPSSEMVPAIYLARLKKAITIATYDDARRLNMPATFTDYVTFSAGSVADRIIPRIVSGNAATSTMLRKRILEIAPEKRAFIFPPVVDTEQFQECSAGRAAYRREFGVKEEMLVGYLGTFWIVEGVKVLLSAAKELRNKQLGFKMVVCGEAHEGLPCDCVSELVDEFGLRDIVRQTGWLEKKDVINVMSACDVLVVPKLLNEANKAGMPAKLAEYMSMGKAVVVSRIGDIPLYAKDGQDCLMCEPGNASNIASALYRLGYDEPLRRSLGAAARISAQKHFDSRGVALSFLTEMTYLTR